MHLVYVWENLGPYHVARMNALGKQPNVRVTVVERYRRLPLRAWRVPAHGTHFQWHVQHDDPSKQRALPLEARDIATTIASHEPDLVLWGTAIYASVELMAVGLLRRRGIPSMAHFVSTAADRRAGGMAQHLLKGALLKAYAGYLPVGIRQLDYLLSLGVASEQCFVVGNPVDNLAFGGVESGSLPEGLEHGRYFLYVGRFAPEKNLSLLLRAYRRHASAMEHPWPLVLVGSGPSEASLRDEAAASEGAGHVVFLPFTEGQALSRLYGAAGCFVLPSLSEPWGLVVNEATAAGLPVILSDRCGCLPHLLREPENGWSFDPRDEDALVRYLARASSADLDREAVASVSRRLASGQTVERYAELVARGCHTTLERWARKGSA